jgi:type VI protein secretion system component VasK
MEVKNTQLQDRYEIYFREGKYTSRYALGASSIINPFRMRELEEFRCPRL